MNEKPKHPNRQVPGHGRCHGYGVTRGEWYALMEQYGFRCLCCGETGAKLTLDHVYPKNHGGKHEIENIQPLCSICNKKKGRARIIDYRTTPIVIVRLSDFPKRKPQKRRFGHRRPKRKTKT